MYNLVAWKLLKLFDIASSSSYKYIYRICTFLSRPLKLPKKILFLFFVLALFAPSAREKKTARLLWLSFHLSPSRLLFFGTSTPVFLFVSTALPRHPEILDGNPIQMLRTFFLHFLYLTKCKITEKTHKSRHFLSQLECFFFKKCILYISIKVVYVYLYLYANIKLKKILRCFSRSRRWRAIQYRRPGGHGVKWVEPNKRYQISSYCFCYRFSYCIKWWTFVSVFSDIRLYTVAK